MASPPPQSALLADLGEQYFAAKHSYDPFNATLLGLTEFDGVTGSPSAETSARAEARFAELGQAVAALDPDTLSEAEKIDRQVLTGLLRGAETDAHHSLWAANISSAGYVSRQGTLFEALAATEVMDDTTADRYLSRLAALPTYAAELAVRHRHEIAQGRLPTAVGVRNAVRQLRSEVAGGVDSALLRPVEREAGDQWREDAVAMVEASVRPALTELADVLEAEAAPVARPDDKVGVCWVPGGEEAYAAALAQNTTTDLSPEQIHAIGLEMLAELDVAWAEIGQVAFGTGDRDDIVRQLRADPALRFESSEQIVTLVADAMLRAEEALPRYFPADIEVGTCDIVELSAEESANSALAYYRPPATDGSRNGAQCIATSDPASRYRYEYEALCFHESTPGHHLQLATSQQLDLPRYRRYLDAEVCGFNEGWGLYTEQLADELGLYSDDYARLGMLSFQALRACRLVVDTGMHAQGWTRQQAVDFMWENTATTRENVEHEIDRYIAWPGQACAYAIGKREILRMRAEAEAALGEAFELPAFHWAVIRNGAIPLSVAAAAVRSWVATATP
ncbi:MAG TPA: DUF885 domain-containing protein [Nocardioides sp.]|nr:DUF885 domain-containing protein [Nocardioides sp.]